MKRLVGEMVMALIVAAILTGFAACIQAVAALTAGGAP